MKKLIHVIFAGLFLLPSIGNAASQKVGANEVAEIALSSDKTYKNPFMEVQLDAVVTEPNGAQLRVPAFWDGGKRWRFRYSSAIPGVHKWTTDCSDKSNTQLQGVSGRIEVVPYRGDNPLYRHGLVRVAADRRHFECADGTPFFWLGDTWWKGLCKRLTWEGFQELTADRKAKGFSVVQIVCGNYPDEGMFETRWENEAGKPYETKDFSVVNPAYFYAADRRIRHLIDAGITPAIVGGWGRPQGGAPGTISVIGVPGYERHWRNLVAHYGAYPVIWIIGGEAGGPEWAAVGAYLKKTDPWHHLTTDHPPESARNSVGDTSIDFDMLQTGHGDWNAARGAIPKLKAAYARTPTMPVLIGEYCYEGHMQTGLQDQQRYVFWGSLLSGAAGITYGGAGIWSASVKGDPGCTPIYDYTPWKVSMNYPGSTELGLGKRLLEKYPWWRFEPHPEWVEPGCFAAGIPGQVRFIYMPRLNVYDWSGPTVKNLEPNVDWHAYYFDPVSGCKFDEGVVKASATPVDYKHPVPSPQDWVLVLEKMKS